MDDLRNSLLAGTVGARDQYAHVAAGDAAGEFDNPLHFIGSKYDAAEVILFRQALAPAPLLVVQPLPFAVRFRQLQQVLHRREQLVVIPWLADIVGGAGLD
jgi:hypothetical protein